MENCIMCNRYIRRMRRHILSQDLLENRRGLVEHIVRDLEPPQEVAFDGTRVVCHPCWHRLNTLPAPQAPVAPAPTADSFVIPGLSRVANTSRRCMIDSCNSLQLRQLPNTVKGHLFSYYNLFIPPLAKICVNHLHTFQIQDISDNISQRLYNFKPSHVLDIRSMYIEMLEQKNLLDFENIDEIAAEDLHFWTGLNYDQFEELLNLVPSLQRNSRTPRTDLGIFLSKIRTGEPNVRLGTVFCKSRQNIDTIIHSTRMCLLTDFVPRYLGLDHITRTQCIEKNRSLPNHLFNNEHNSKLILICDGTYIYIQKSTNFHFQRKSYSTHKYQNLIKPFMIVCGNGYILDVAGPYDASVSDAIILKNIIENHGNTIEEAPISYFLEDGDIFILDRGFRDCIPVLESYGYEAHMPLSVTAGSQLTTEQANKSRRVTLCRWVVEAVNGRFKRDFKLFRNKSFNRSLKSTMSDFKIAAALINCFQQPYGDNVYTEQFKQIINNTPTQNMVSEYVQRHNLNQIRVTFTRLHADDDCLNGFPMLTHEDMILFAIGTYHLKIARFYCSEHIKRTGVYEIELFRPPVPVQINGESYTFIRTRIQSRHVRRKTYKTYILYKTEDHGNKIAGHYCSCIHGNRTLGCCAHVMSILYYLGWARHQGAFRHPALYLDHVVLDVTNH